MWSSSITRLHKPHAQSACVKHLDPYCVLYDECSMASVRTVYFAMLQLNCYCHPQGIRELGVKQLTSFMGLSGNIWGRIEV